MRESAVWCWWILVVGQLLRDQLILAPSHSPSGPVVACRCLPPGPGPPGGWKASEEVQSQPGLWSHPALVLARLVVPLPCSEIYYKVQNSLRNFSTPNLSS